MSGSKGPNTRYGGGNLDVLRRYVAGESVDLIYPDLFNTSQEGGTTVDPHFFQTSNRSRTVRRLLLGASWTFGKADKGKDTINLSGDNAP